MTGCGPHPLVHRITLLSPDRGRRRFLPTVHDAPLKAADASFAEAVIHAALNAIERAYDLEAAKSDRERFQFLANTDPLTGCVNRRAMLDRLEPELERGRRYRHKVTVLMIDFDWFKEDQRHPWSPSRRYGAAEVGRHIASRGTDDEYRRSLWR